MSYWQRVSVEFAAVIGFSFVVATFELEPELIAALAWVLGGGFQFWQEQARDYRHG